jgi:hypothetical protein
VRWHSDILSSSWCLAAIDCGGCRHHLSLSRFFVLVMCTSFSICSNVRAVVFVKTTFLFNLSFLSTVNRPSGELSFHKIRCSVLRTCAFSSVIVSGWSHVPRAVTTIYLYYFVTPWYAEKDNIFVTVPVRSRGMKPATQHSYIL